MGPKDKPRKKKPPSDSPSADEEITDALESEGADLSEAVLKRLPHLAAEMKSSDTEVRIEGVRWEETERTRQPIVTGKQRFSSYSPDVIDFLRRCANKEEALEVINFLEKRGEISATHAKELREQLRTKGIRSFGSKKAWGHYEREG